MKTTSKILNGFLPLNNPYSSLILLLSKVFIKININNCIRLIIIILDALNFNENEFIKIKRCFCRILSQWLNFLFVNDKIYHLKFKCLKTA